MLSRQALMVGLRGLYLKYQTLSALASVCDVQLTSPVTPGVER